MTEPDYVVIRAGVNVEIRYSDYTTMIEAFTWKAELGPAMLPHITHEDLLSLVTQIVADTLLVTDATIPLSSLQEWR